MNPQTADSSISAIESALDADTKKYKSFDKTKPMRYISYEETRNKYRVNIGKSSVRFDNLNEATIYVKSHIEKSKGTIDIIPNKYCFTYATYQFIAYNYKSKAYFDIEHIISYLGLGKSEYYSKHSHYSKNIAYRYFYPNGFGGYNLREMINAETVCNILFSSNSDLSKKFKKDVSKIIAGLQQAGELNLIDGSIVKTKSKNTRNMNSSDDRELILSDDHNRLFTYNNESDKQKIKQYIKDAQQIKLENYNKKRVIYAFIITVSTGNSNRYIYVKFGYTDDIFKTKNRLIRTYGATLKFLRIHLVHNLRKESTLHKFLKIQYTDNVVVFENRRELYIFSESLFEAFNKFGLEQQQKILANSQFTLPSFFDENIKSEYEKEKKIIDHDYAINQYTHRSTYSEEKQNLIMKFKQEKQCLMMKYEQENQKMSMEHKRKCTLCINKYKKQQFIKQLKSNHTVQNDASTMDTTFDNFLYSSDNINSTKHNEILNIDTSFDMLPILSDDVALDTTMNNETDNLTLNNINTHPIKSSKNEKSVIIRL